MVNQVELTLDKILLSARKFGASDVPLVSGLSPAMRINGDIRIVEGKPLDNMALKTIYDLLLNQPQKDSFDKDWQVCFSRKIEGIGRFRVSVYLHAGGPEFSIRQIGRAHV